MKTEKGQALILIAVGLVALLGLTALAIDGGNAFADRRHAQNAADTSALSAALSKISSQDWQQAALTRAADNTYDNDGVSNTVTVHSPPIEGRYASDPNKNEYIQVIIVSRVDTWFARIVGVDHINNRVLAVARAKPAKPFYDGHSVVALSPGDGKNNTPEIKFYGSAVEVGVTGSGIFANSSDGCAVDTSGSPDLTAPYINSPGTVCGVSGITTGSGTQYPFPPDYSYLDDLCSKPNAVNINGDFPDSTINSNTIYCISGDFKINGGNYSATNVTFVIGGGVSISGNGTLNLKSPPNSPLFYLPYAASKVNNNKYTVTINGNSDMELVGQLLAPASHCKLNGTGATNPLSGQVICYTLELGGNSDAVVIYNDIDNMDEPPQIELTQ